MAINSPFLVLILKKDEANSLDQLRPIYLFNFVYNIISKLITERLNSSLGKFISEEQGGYVARRKFWMEW